MSATSGYKNAHQHAKTAKSSRDTSANKPTQETAPPRLVSTFGFPSTSQSKPKAASTRLETFDSAMQNFTESAKIGLDVLSELAEIHPFIKAPVLAFKLVVALDLKRRENNAKVIAVKVQMQSMMSVLIQLRDIKDPDIIGSDGLTLPGRLHELMEEIAKYIKECASACDLYMKKSLVRKYLKSFIYEGRLAAYVARFAEYEVELQKALAMHTAFGVDVANEKLDELKDMQSQIRELLVRLDTPREKEIRDMIESGGGAVICVNSSQLLEALIEKTGEDMTNLAGRKKSELAEMRQSLIEELSEDVDAALQRNLALFEGKLDIQQREIEEITRQGDRIVAYLAGGHERIIDPQIREIWKEMGWKSTVKARHFVLALRDYFLNDKGTQLAISSGVTPPPSAILSPPATSSSEQFEYNSSPSPQGFGKNDWAQSYVNVSYLQAISESIDDDGSGFINIQEINHFTMMRPKGWSLLQWLAYWAAGWHSSISMYSTKIYRTLRKIYKLRDKVRTDNRRALETHLTKKKFYRLELLLRSTKTLPDGTTMVPELVKLRDDFVADEERRLRENLEKISYTIDSTATVSLITGPGRIERFIYPLIYLLLTQFVKSVQLGRTHILHIGEFETSYDSLLHIFSSFDTRLEDLSAIFRQMHIDPERQLENFAYGMFKTSYGAVTWQVAGCSLVPTWGKLPAEPGEDDDITECPKDIPLEILKFGSQDPLNYPTLIPFTPTEQVDDGPKILEGSWAGYTSIASHKSLLFRLTLGEIIGDRRAISGTGNVYFCSMEVTGVLTTTVEEEGSEATNSVDLVIANQDGYWIRCTGVLDVSSATITGDWYSRNFLSEPKPLSGSDTNGRRVGSFQFCRTPAPLARFRYTQDDFEKSRAQARWRFACAAVLHQVQRDRLSKDYVVTRLRNGRRFKELNIKHLFENFGYSRQSPLTDDERGEFRELRSIMCPTVDQFYHSIARYVFQRVTLHVGVFCDGPNCRRKILQSRLLCIVCIDKCLVDSLDFCIACCDAELPNHPTHTSSHTLLRGDRFLQDCTKAWMIPVAREESERIKTRFRERDLAPADKKNTVKEHDGQEVDGSQGDDLVCSFCDKPISLPCWVFLKRPGNSLVCDQCEIERLRPPVPEKLVATPPSMVYAMMRIKDDKPVEIPDDDKLARVEQRLTGVKENVQERLENLENRLITRTSALESILTSHLQASAQNIQNASEPTSSLDRFDQRLDALEARFTSLEKLLQDFVGKANITSAQG